MRFFFNSEALNLDREAIKAVLFDLDGTLIDSAPDLAFAANDMLAVRGLPPLPLARCRPLAGSGARGMLALAFGVRPSSPAYSQLKLEFFQVFEAHLAAKTTVFDGIDALLTALNAVALPWGIVTNKAERFALPSLELLRPHAPALAACAAVVGGDTTAHTKPHPAPLLLAAQRLGVAPADCVYVGDDVRDIAAGQAAGMRTVACTWGYLGQNTHAHQWGATAVASSPAELLGLLLP